MTEREIYQTSPAAAGSIYHRDSTGGESSENYGPEFDDLCEELGITPETHPHLRHPHRRGGSTSFSTIGESLLQSSRCHLIASVACLIGTSLIVASAVSKGFEHAARRDHLLHPQWIEEERAKEDKDWWVEGDEKKDGSLHSGKGNLTEKEMEQLSYDLSDAYLPIWFDRNTGWKGRSYKEAMEFCQSHDDFVPCPYEVSVILSHLCIQS